MRPILPIFLLLIIFQVDTFKFPKLEIDPSGTDCIGCTLFVRILQMYIINQEIPCPKLLESFCDLIPDTPTWSKWKKRCFEALDILAPVVCQYLEEGVTPDNICRKILFCKGWEKCTLFKDSPVRGFKNYDEKFQADIDFFQLLWKSYKSDMINSSPVGDSLVPSHLDDKDGDYFSTKMDLRGGYWRGRDCNDENKNVYPGRKKNPLQKGTDYNCNGISGLDKQGRSYEDVLCGNSSRFGLVVIGDSHCSHFRIPEQWFQKNSTIESLKYLFPLIENEVDWPHLGLYAGFQNDTTGLNPAPVDSLNMHLKRRNRCNHRDYQLLCHNGGKSNDVLPYMRFIDRNADSDHPVIAIISIVGNDVCNHHADGSGLTTPKVFHDRILEGLKFLDEKIPSGSHVVFNGFANGLILWNVLHDSNHPLGPKYSEIYDYMNCLDVSPCAGWMNLNETIRNNTQKRADELSQEYIKILNNYKFKNFDLYYINFKKVVEEGIAIFIKEGRDPASFIEPFDGFHPSQWSEEVIKDLMVKELEKMNPKIFGEENPLNEQIVKIFGEQGGY